jgi:hypothetical protein
MVRIARTGLPCRKVRHAHRHTGEMLTGVVADAAA